MSNEKMREALRSIANSTCCGRCQEAALVARAALGAQRQAEPVVLTAEDVAEARTLLARCSASAVLSGDDDEARGAFDDRAVVYRMVCEANALLIGDTLPADEVTDAQRMDFIAKNARCDPKMDGQHVWWPTTFNNALRGPTLREAIDAAMQKDTQ